MGVYTKYFVSYHRHICCSSVFISVLFTIARQERCPSMAKWVVKMPYLYTTEFCSTLKKNELMRYADKGIELKNILNELIQISHILTHILASIF